MIRKLLLSVIAALIAHTAFCQKSDLLKQIAQIAKEGKGITGVAVLNLESRDSLNYNANSQLVMQSVFKFPIAMAVLHRVDEGKLKLDQKIHFTKKDLPPTYSPLRDKYPYGGNLPLSDILAYMVSDSDNDACDILIKMMGGVKVIEDYVFSLGVKGISIKATEADMASAWEIQYTDWCKPSAITRLLDIFYSGRALQKPTNDFLWKLMVNATTGAKRIKGLLPANTVVAHKTGTSGTNSDGLSPATNDAGIIVLPNGQHLAITILLCNSTADTATRELVIAKIAKAVCDAYSR